MDFGKTLKLLDDGKAHTELTIELGRVIDAVLEHRRTGKIVLTLYVDYEKDETISIRPVSKTTMPKRDSGRSRFWVEHGKLIGRDPNQPELVGLSLAEPDEPDPVPDPDGEGEGDETEAEAAE